MSDLLLRPPVGSAVESAGSAAPMESTIRGHQVNTMKRSLSWVDVFFIASGVPALVLFSIGALANQVGTPSNLVWTISVCMGFFQAFTYGSWVKHHPAGFSLHFPAGLLPFPAMPPAAGAATAAPADARREAASTAAVSLFFIISTTLQFFRRGTVPRQRGRTSPRPVFRALHKEACPEAARRKAFRRASPPVPRGALPRSLRD